ncbi:TetR/AcrR family transcriptional regulator [Streptomyces sp. 12297]
MGATRTPRDRWIEAGLRALADGGPDAVRIEVLAQALGVTKGGFYGYFRNRDALLGEMLDTWEREVTDAIIERVERGGGNGREKLERLFALVSVAAADGDATALSIAADLAIRDWARRDEAVAARLRRTDNRRMEFLRAQFREFCADEDEVEARCLLTFSLRIANHFIGADHEGRSRAEVMRLAARNLLRQ